MKKWIAGFCILLLMWVGLMVSRELTEDQAHIGPNCKKENLTEQLQITETTASANREGLDAENGRAEPDYDFIYHQTGLGPSAAAKILEEPDGEKKLLEFQETFFRRPALSCTKDILICRKEQTVNEQGETVRAWKLAELEDGDIIVTKSSHVFGWRNGHAALVVDAQKGKTLEAVVIGENTAMRKFTKWEKYPNALVLRLAGADAETRKKVAQWAKENLLDIPYLLTTGLWGAENGLQNVEGGLQGEEDHLKGEEGGLQGEEDQLQELTGTQCAHLIWRAYMEFGINLDSDGGRLVTPKDLANSPLLEVVQVYGMDPDDPWP